MNNIGKQAVMYLAATTLILAAGGAPAATPTTFEAIGPINSDVTDMSADGSVLVGSSLFGPPSFRWTRDSGTELIGGTGGFAKVSDDGSVISGNVEVDGHSEAALWLGGENWQPLGGLSTSGCPNFSSTFGISGNGQVVVGLGWDGCSGRAFRWEESTGMVDMGNLGPGNASRANGVNADGSILVGWDDGLSERRGARWVNGVETLLADNTEPGVYLGEAQAITPDGSVIVGGGAGLANGNYDEAYIWTEERGGRLIGKLLGGQFASTWAIVVSDDGTLLAGSSGPQFKIAFLWTAQTGILNLQDYLVDQGVTGLDGWTLGGVSGMSADGTKIAGWALNPDGLSQSWLVENLIAPADSDSDGVLDTLDNCSTEANADQRDTNGDGFGNACDPDLNNDLVINFADLGLLKAVFFSADEDADFDGDGAVNFVDLGVMKERFFGMPGPSGQVP